MSGKAGNDERGRNRNTAIFMAGLLAASLFLHLWGIRKDLPFVPDIDERIIVNAAVKINSPGNLNPGWFGQPASTVIYPLALVYRAWNALLNHGGLWKADKNLGLRFDENDSAYYYIGRIIAVFWNVGILWVIFLVGRDLFDRNIGLIGAGLYLTYCLAVAQSQLVRSNSVAAFFSLLALWLILRVYSNPKINLQTAVGVAIGLGIASRYFMVALIPVYLATNVALLIGKRNEAQEVKRILGGMIAGFAAMTVAFLAISPYFILDFQTAVADIKLEARTAHAGADGLSPLGNMGWYLAHVFPESMTWVQMLLAAAGMVMAAVNRHMKAIFGVLFVLVFFIGVSVQHLHWARWVMEILPVLAIFAAWALNQAVHELARYFKLPAKPAAILLITAFIAVSIKPSLNVIHYNLSQARYSTRIDMYHWVTRNIPYGSRIANEWYTAPLLAKHYINEERSSLAERTLDDYDKDGYEYLMVGSQRYSLFLNDPARYQQESGFYQHLFSEGELVKTVAPKPGQAGPEIRLYRIKRSETTGDKKGTGS